MACVLVVPLQEFPLELFIHSDTTILLFLRYYMWLGERVMEPQETALRGLLKRYTHCFGRVGEAEFVTM